MGKEDVQRLAANLKALRSAAELSQQDLAVKAGLSLSVVSQLEQGKKTDPRMSTVTALASALGIDVGRLLGADVQAEDAAKKPKSKRRK